MRKSVLGFLLVAAAALAACGGKKTDKQTVALQPAEEIAWRLGDVDDAFHEARESGKPVLLYWGAKWCPPCNQLKATLFQNPSFVAQTRNFIPVYLDGDSKGAQAWGERFGISGYPTVIVLGSDRSEITRISSGADAANIAALLEAAAVRTNSFDDLLAKAERDPSRVTPEDWALLADYDWQNDPKRFGDSEKASALLAKFAHYAPDAGGLRRRFALLALAVGVETDENGTAKLTPDQRKTVQAVLPAILASPAEIKANRQQLVYAAPPLVAALDAGSRKDIGGKLIAALDRLHGDDSLSVADRFATINGDIVLARAELGAGQPLPAPVLAKVRQRVAWADRAARDPVTRQSVISEAAFRLDLAGDPAGAIKLLKAELPRSRWAYYYMLDLSSLAEEQGDKAGAIDWARQAFEKARGPATRVQWAIAYSNTVMRLDPANHAAVEQSASAVLGALAQSGGDYYQRTRAKVSAWGEALRKWADANKGQDVLLRLNAKMKDACGGRGDARTSCLAAIRIA